MAEIVEYRVERTIDELNLLVEFGLFSKQHAHEILKQRQDFEYVLRRRNKTKLDYLKYIRFEINLLESIEKYRRTVIKDYYKDKGVNKLEEIDRKILLLQAKKLNDIIRSRAAHISSLFRKLTTSSQFDSKLWLAYIEFAKSRNWNTRVSSLYWRLLRVCSDDETIWIAAASHEIQVNKAYDAARSLYLRALRHSPESVAIWFSYFKMELKFTDIVDQRARIVFKVIDEHKKTESNEVEAKWAEDELELKDSIEEFNDGSEDKSQETKIEPPLEMPSDDLVMTGHLSKTVFEKALVTLDSRDILKFVTQCLVEISNYQKESKGIEEVKSFILEKLRNDNLNLDNDELQSLIEHSSDQKYLDQKVRDLEESGVHKFKKLKSCPTRLENLYDSYETKGIDQTRDLFNNLERSVKNQSLSLYVGMIQVEVWELAKQKSEEQLDRIRSIYNKALFKFGKTKSKLWYEFLKFEHDNAKSLKDFERINQLYTRAQSTLEPSKVDKVIEKFTLMQSNPSSAILEYSDYSDLED